MDTQLRVVKVAQLTHHMGWVVPRKGLGWFTYGKNWQMYSPTYTNMLSYVQKMQK